MESNENPPDRPDSAVCNRSETADQPSESRPTTRAAQRHRQIPGGIGSAAIVAALLFVNRPKTTHTGIQGEQAPPDID